MALSYDALITPEEFVELTHDALGTAIESAISDGSGAIYQAVEQSIENASRSIDNYLKRRLIVRSRVLRFDPSCWVSASGWINVDGDPLMRLMTPEWPVLELTAIDYDDAAATLAIFSIHEGTMEPGRFIVYDPQELDAINIPSRLVAFVGYRRRDQSIAGSGSGDVTDLDEGVPTVDLSGLTVEPPELPYDIRLTCARLVQALIAQAAKGLVGIGRTTKRIDRLEVDNTESVDRGFWQRELNRLHAYRNLAGAV